MLENQRIDDDALRRYLLGAIAEEDRERLDELSVADEGIAARLEAVENDLVDAYVRGDLPRETEQRFKATYLTTPAGRNKVAVAEALYERDRAASHHEGMFTRWAIAAAITLAVVAGGFFVARKNAATVPQSAAAHDGPARRTAATSTIAPIESVAVTLLPATRAATAVPAVTIPRTTQYVAMTLQLESDDFPQYSAALRDLVRNQIIWQSAPVRAASNAVTIDIPADSLASQNYSIELTGIGAGGSRDLVGAYTVHVTRSERSN